MEMSEQPSLRRAERCHLDPGDGILRMFRSRAIAFIDSPPTNRAKISRTMLTSAELLAPDYQSRTACRRSASPWLPAFEARSECARGYPHGVHPT